MDRLDDVQVEDDVLLLDALDLVDDGLEADGRGDDEAGLAGLGVGRGVREEGDVRGLLGLRVDERVLALGLLGDKAVVHDVVLANVLGDGQVDEAEVQRRRERLEARLHAAGDLLVHVVAEAALERATVRREQALDLIDRFR